jgi:hypothetical protein
VASPVRVPHWQAQARIGRLDSDCQPEWRSDSRVTASASTAASANGVLAHWQCALRLPMPVSGSASLLAEWPAGDGFKLGSGSGWHWHWLGTQAQAASGSLSLSENCREAAQPQSLPPQVR